MLVGVRVGLMHSWGDYRLMQSLRTTVKRFLRELATDLLYGEVVHLLDVCLKETGTLSPEDVCTSICNDTGEP